MLKRAPSPQKETSPIYGNRYSFDQTRKSCPYKAGMNRLKSNKCSNLLIWTSIIYKTFPTTATHFFQLPMYPTIGKVSHQYLLTIRILCSTLSKLKNFSNCRKRCAPTKNPRLHLWSYKACNSIYFASSRWPYIKVWSEIQKGFFLRWHCILHWWGEHRVLCRFWLWYYFLPWNCYEIQRDQPRSELHFQILWKTLVHFQQRST